MNIDQFILNFEKYLKNNVCLINQVIFLKYEIMLIKQHKFKPKSFLLTSYDFINNFF